ncbi:MAG TPA: sialidase family protein [Gemmataceae bacterium]|nr:sialidase family protein [Gemmataceae bacterium]
MAYRRDQVGIFLSHDYDWPSEITCLLRRAVKKSQLFLVLSDGFITSKDDGKTWSTPHIIPEHEDHAQMVETDSGELLLFSSASTPASEGRRSEIHLRRRKDGKEWSDAKWIVETYNSRKICAFVDRKLIWLAYADKNAKRDGSTIFLTRSSDDGKTWETALPLTDGIHDDSEPALAVQGDTLFLAFARPIPRDPGAREADFKRQIWYGYKAIKEIEFPRAK